MPERQNKLSINKIIRHLPSHTITSNLEAWFVPYSNTPVTDWNETVFVSLWLKYITTSVRDKSYNQYTSQFNEEIILWLLCTLTSFVFWCVTFLFNQGACFTFCVFDYNGLLLFGSWFLFWICFIIRREFFHLVAIFICDKRTKRLCLMIASITNQCSC